jgi:hypothetical protein
MEKFKIQITKEDVGYSAYGKFGDISVHTEGDNWNEMVDNILDALRLTFEGKNITEKNLVLIYDVPSFFKSFKVINAKAFSEKIGINHTLMAQYVTGKKVPSRMRTQKIIKGIHDIGRELADVRFLEK